MERGFQRFSLETSCHGFSELYHSKSPCWKFFWTLILIGAFGVTSYQMYYAVLQFISQPTSIQMSHAEEHEILYPPMRICFQQWMFWIDWYQYIHFIYSSTTFDIGEASYDFNGFMESHKFTSISQFYKSIARKVPIVGDHNITDYFDGIDIIYKSPGFLFCYKISEKQMMRYFADNVHIFEEQQEGKIISFVTFDETYENVKEYVALDEYNQYMVGWVNYKSSYNINGTGLDNNLTSFAPPILVYPNAYHYRSVDIFTENNLYTITLQASARSYIDNAKNDCLNDYQSIAANDTCKKICKAKYNKNICSCISVEDSIVLQDDNQINFICRRGVNLVEPNVKGNNVKYSPDQKNCFPTAQDTLEYNTCKKNCPVPCTEWIYETIVSTTRMSTIVRNFGTKNTTSITIEYPFGRNIIIMSEVNSQTWINFIGSVGGLLGIWTGASIISFIQFFYLCCLADTDGICSSSIRNRKKIYPTNEENVKKEKNVTYIHVTSPV